MSEPYKLGKKLGSGTFGVTYTVRNDPTLVIKASKNKQYFLSYGFLREAMYLQAMQNHHLRDHKESPTRPAPFVGVRGVDITRQRILLDRWPCDGHRTMDSHHRRVFFAQFVSALFFAECKGLFVRDIKPANVLLNPETMKLCLCDLGSMSPNVRTGPDGRPFLTSRPCTPITAAPEILQGRRYFGSQAQVWAAGATLYAWRHSYLPCERPLIKPRLEIKPRVGPGARYGDPRNFMSTGRAGALMDTLFPSESETEAAWPSRLAREPESLLPPADDAEGDLINRMLEADPDRRLTWTQVFRHPYFSGMADIQRLVPLAGRLEFDPVFRLEMLTKNEPPTKLTKILEVKETLRLLQGYSEEVDITPTVLCVLLRLLPWALRFLDDHAHLWAAARPKGGATSVDKETRTKDTIVIVVTLVQNCYDLELDVAFDTSFIQKHFKSYAAPRPLVKNVVKVVMDNLHGQLFWIPECDLVPAALDAQVAGCASEPRDGRRPSDGLLTHRATLMARLNQALRARDPVFLAAFDLTQPPVVTALRWVELVRRDHLASKA